MRDPSVWTAIAIFGGALAVVLLSARWPEVSIWPPGGPATNSSDPACSPSSQEGGNCGPSGDGGAGGGDGGGGST
jgi:hypothetical protein